MFIMIKNSAKLSLTVCWNLPKTVCLKLMHSNPRLKQWEILKSSIRYPYMKWQEKPQKMQKLFIQVRQPTGISRQRQIQVSVPIS